MTYTVDIPAPALLPFVLLLGAIAVLPLSAAGFWDRNRNKLLVAVALSVPAVGFLAARGLGDALYHSLVFDYVPFIVLLGSLFVVTGGIVIEGDLEARPLTNTSIMGIGAVLASLMGTTGASMLLIRSLLHTNRERQFKSHTVLFFIAIVCNCGGLLTPLGDPPLFMMYLRGASFTWFFRLLPEWLFVNGSLLLVYYLVDSCYWRRETPQARTEEHRRIRPLFIRGWANLIWLGGIVLAVAFINPNNLPALGGNPYRPFVREAVLVLMALLSWGLTPRSVHHANHFTWRPMEEVAYLFLGIFITMVPCLMYLAAHARSLGTPSAALFYYATGALSSVLDNTPTALNFYSLAVGLGQDTPRMVAGIPEYMMKAICTGAVFFGAMTYIGNGPNFMVKTIAEHQGVRMPHFFEYVFKFGLIVLLPIFVLAQLAFIR